MEGLSIRRASASPGSRARRLVAWISAAAVVGAGLVAGGTAPAQAAETPVSGATLDWGIKQSFRDYVVGSIAHGSIEVADGATRNPDGTFRFTQGAGSYDDAGRLTELSFQGTVRFRGHDGALELDVHDPSVELNGDQSVLRADMTSKDMATGVVVDYPDVVVANLDAQAGTYTADGDQSRWRGIPATFAAAGVPAFAGFYYAGTVIDPVSLDYTGPGGKPVVTAETWDAPRQPSFSVASTALPAGYQPGVISYDSDHDWIWIPSYAKKQVIAVDATTFETKASVTFADQMPRRVIYSTHDQRVYVVDTVVSVLEEGAGGTWSVVDTLPRPVNSGASNNIDLDPATGDLWLSWSVDAQVVRVFTLGEDDEYTHRDISFPADFYPGKVFFASDGSKVVIGDTSRGNIAGAYRLVGPAGSETVQEIPGAQAVSGYALLDDDSLVQVAPDYSNYPVVTTSIKRWTLSAAGFVEADPLVAVAPDVSGSAVASFNSTGTALAGVSLNYRQLRIMLDGVFSKPRDLGANVGSTLVTDDDVVFVTTSNSQLHRLDLAGTAPAFTAAPADRTVDLATGQTSAPAAFEVAATDGATLRWQTKAPGATRFSDVAGATSTSLELAGTIAAHGTQVRVIAKNEYGEVASPVATLTVLAAPTLVAPPRSVTVTEGTPAVFTTSFTGQPAPALVWEREVGGFWEPIDSGDENFVLEENSLMVPETSVAQSGTRLRARVRNASGTVRSSVVTLRVEPKVAIGPEGLRLTGVDLDWTGSEELQSAPPFGGSNYFSAGTSAGDQATYRASAGDVSILHVAADGTETPATYATRAAQATTDVTQVARLSDGDAVLRADGSATVTWDGSWSVNFYGGLVPFTLTDPVLTVDEDGTGTLEADLSGYASSMADPEVREPLTPVADVTVATFSGVEIDPAGSITVTPEYAGVELQVPAGQTAQNRTATGWGSWPQEFVDVHFATGLSSYWYTSGGAADAKKPPTPFVVDFRDAAPAVDVTSSTTVTLAPSSHRYGASTTATVRVGATGTTPTGRVTVRVAGRTLTGTLAGGTARVVLPADLRPGTYAVVAGYAGATGVRSSTGSATLRVTKARPAVGLRLSAARVDAGRRVRATVTVRVPGSGDLRPAGRLVVRDRGRVVARVALRPGHDGRVVVRLPRLARGTHVLRVSLPATALQAAGTSPRRTLRVR